MRNFSENKKTYVVVVEDKRILVLGLILGTSDGQTIFDLDRALEVLLHRTFLLLIIILFWHLIMLLCPVRIWQSIRVGFFLRIWAQHVVHVTSDLKIIGRARSIYVMLLRRPTAILLIELLQLLHAHLISAIAHIIHRRTRIAAVKRRKICFFKLVFLLFDVEILSNAIVGHTILPLRLVVYLERHLAFSFMTRLQSHGWLIPCLQIVLHFQLDLGCKFINYNLTQEFSFYTGQNIFDLINLINFSVRVKNEI